MPVDKTMVQGQPGTPLSKLKTQRSHNLLVLSNPLTGQEQNFLSWYSGVYLEALLASENVLQVQHYDPHEVDITRGAHAPLPYRYLSIIELSIDGAQAAEALIHSIQALHNTEASAQNVATWLYYPISEQVGCSSTLSDSMLTLAFANPVSGCEDEFREWYSTRHIRHALNIPALISGQCFELTQYQHTGSGDALYKVVALSIAGAAPALLWQ